MMILRVGEHLARTEGECRVLCCQLLRFYALENRKKGNNFGLGSLISSNFTPNVVLLEVGFEI